ncbi:inositol phosphophingolipids phospholipase C [Lactarius indigo]|nr:inositol phosphophingolipids phospholipase C [Lactarius indigo]
MSTTVETRIEVFSLNLLYVSKRRSERIQAIARFLESSDFDIVALQELWVYADYEIVRTRLSKSLPFSKFFYSGALGAGLAIFSRFPIVAATIHPYSLNGSPLDVLGGDWFVGKAAASVIIRHPTLGQVQVFNTHLYAKGGEGGAEHHRAHRLVNAWEFAKLAKQAAELGRYVIAAGDFNSVPTSLPMAVIRDHASLSDAWGSTSSLSPTQAVEVYGVTADSPLNTYSAGKSLDVHARTFCGKRLDYILFGDPVSPLAPAAPLPTLVATHARVLLTDPVPGLPFSYSDHFGVSATLHINSPPADAATVLRSLVTCYRHAHARAKRHLLVFGFSVGALISLIAGAGRFPPEATRFVVLGSAVFTWLGTTMFYVGFVHGRWETNALLNVIDELELYRKSVEVAPVGEFEMSIKP